MKRLTALVLILAVFLSASPAAAAGRFTDVANSSEAWAEQYIEDMAERGLFTGYPDGTFRPKENIILLHTLVLLSRLYDTDEETEQLVLNEYRDFLTEILPGKETDWAFLYLAVCLETGIVTDEELRDFAVSGDLDKPVSKEFFAVLLAKAIGLGDEAQALTEYRPPFDDYLLIKYAYWPYIYMLYSKQIITGNLKNEFNPGENVSRAVAATMVSRAVEYIETNAILLRITRFSEYRTYGVLSEIGTNGILVKGYDGTAKRVSLPSGIYVRADGAAASLSDKYLGKRIALVRSKEDSLLKGIEIDTGSTVVQGALKAVETETATKKIYITDLATGVATGYTLGTNMGIYYEDAAVQLSSLKAGYYATVIVENNIVTSIYAFPGTYEKTGTLSSIIFGDPVTFIIADENDEITEISFAASRIPPIWKGGSLSGADRLRAGDSLKLTVKDCVVTRIDASVKEADLTGTIVRFTRDATGNILTISNEAGVELSYKLAPDVLITQNSRKLTLDSLNAGSKVKLAITDNLVTSIEVDELVTENIVLSGTVMYLNTRDTTFLLQTPGAAESAQYVSVRLSGTAKVLVAKDGTFSSFKNLKIYDIVDVYGSYSGDQFEATIIIIRSSTT